MGYTSIIFHLYYASWLQGGHVIIVCFLHWRGRHLRVCESYGSGALLDIKPAGKWMFPLKKTRKHRFWNHACMPMGQKLRSSLCTVHSFGSFQSWQCNSGVCNVDLYPYCIHPVPTGVDVPFATKNGLRRLSFHIPSQKPRQIWSSFQLGMEPNYLEDHRADRKRK